MAEMVDFGPKEGTFVQVTERNRTVLCPVPARAHAIVARAIVVQALAPYLVVGCFGLRRPTDCAMVLLPFPDGLQREADAAN